jgi:hypothetical protein
MISFPKVAAVLGAIALLIPAPARAQPWVLVGENEGAVRYVDTSSIRRQNDAAFFRVLSKNPNPSVPRLGSTITYRMMNCYTGNWAALRQTIFITTGQLISDYTYSEKEIEVNSILPGTLGETIYNFVCH